MDEKQLLAALFCATMHLIPSLAQLVEQASYTRPVPGSIPGGWTFIKHPPQADVLLILDFLYGSNDFF
jgi:hypothetical protein